MNSLFLNFLCDSEQLSPPPPSLSLSLSFTLSLFSPSLSLSLLSLSHTHILSLSLSHTHTLSLIHLCLLFSLSLCLSLSCFYKNNVCNTRSFKSSYFHFSHSCVFPLSLCLAQRQTKPRAIPNRRTNEEEAEGHNIITEMSGKQEMRITLQQTLPARKHLPCTNRKFASVVTIPSNQPHCTSHEVAMTYHTSVVF